MNADLDHTADIQIHACKALSPFLEIWIPVSIGYGCTSHDGILMVVVMREALG